MPRNFFLILFNVLTKLGDLLISPKTVLAWLMSAVGAPALVAWLVPIQNPVPWATNDCRLGSAQGGAEVVLDTG